MLAVALVTLSLVFVSNGLKETSNVPVGTYPTDPGESCKDILQDGGTTSGNYYIKVGGQTLLVYCDQTTAGGGWTLVLSYTFTNFNHFDNDSNAITPRPNWPVEGNTMTSSIPPKSETDFNAMNFCLWNKIGSEFMIKSNINNWVACSEGTGSLVNWVSGTIKCKLVKDVTGRCLNVVPNAFLTSMSDAVPNTVGGPLFYSSIVSTDLLKAYYYLESLTGMTIYVRSTTVREELMKNNAIIWRENGVINTSSSKYVYELSSTSELSYPTHDSCGQDKVYTDLKPTNPHGNIYIR